MVSIRKVTKDNFHETAKLEVHPHQKNICRRKLVFHYRSKF